MSNLQTRLQPNGEEVAAKVLDGEAIMINLSNGTYYSMDKVGGFIWELLEGRHSLREIVDAIAARYDVAQERAQSDVERLAAELVEEQLVIPSNAASGREELQQQSPQRLPYEAPVLNIYRDMADLLALDPPMPGLGDTPWK
jgi:hypothetical protein